MLVTIIMVLACVLLFIAAFGGTFPRVNVGWLGLAIWALAIVLGGAASYIGK
jgi:hypothetical protein